MATAKTTSFELVLERVIDIPPEKVWAAWTKPEHLKKWFTPAPWKTIECEIDLRPGGGFRTVMLSPEGQQFPNVGCYLEVVENKKLVFTDALTPGYAPSGKPFFTAIITLEPHGTGTKYTARGLHKDEADKNQHEQMGFVVGWGIALDQLVAHMKNA
jgi:uncharacterized protein YndB with AHSA1/START domain